MGAELCHVDKQTTELVVGFRNFANAPKIA